MTEIRQLEPGDLSLFEDMMTMFGEVFDEMDTYTQARPSAEYVADLLGNDCFIALAAVDDGRVVGGLAAYELKKFEQARSEIFIYDLGVAESHRRQGVATAMIEKLKEIAAARGAWVMFVQSEDGDEPATELYSKVGRLDVVALHFDIEVPRSDG